MTAGRGAGRAGARRGTCGAATRQPGAATRLGGPTTTRRLCAPGHASWDVCAHCALDKFLTQYCF